MTTRSSAGPLPARLHPTLIATLVAAAAALNVVGGTINNALGLPTYLDMIGTCVAAIVLGPWWGALAGLLTNLGLAVTSGPTNAAFAPVNIAGALVWGYGVRAFGLGRGPVRYFALNVLVALVTAAVAAPIVIAVFGGTTGHASDAITGFLLASGENLGASVLTSNLLTTLADKIIAGYVALAIVAALPASLAAGAELPRSTPMRTVLLATLGVLVGILLIVAFRLVAPA